ncbi:MAG: SGNH/GDSL hydrolase family protein [Bacilli bacterium]|nr:SGNH/GDSL hydrolase family protein [Bacilli bacterium]
MKKFISPKMIFLYCLVFLSVTIIYKNHGQSQIHYLSLGDGYSKGINSYGMIDYGYSDYLKDKLKKENKIQFYTKDFSNKNISIKLLQSNIINNQIIVVNNHKIALKEELQNSNLLTINVGLNDLIYYESLESELNNRKIDQILKEVESDFDSFIKEIRKYYKKEIYVVGYPNNIEDYYLSLSIQKYNNYLRNQKEVIYITPLSNPKYFQNPKSNYPTKEGYEEIANKIYKKYTKNLEK